MKIRPNPPISVISMIQQIVGYKPPDIIVLISLAVTGYIFFYVLKGGILEILPLDPFADIFNDEISFFLWIYFFNSPINIFGRDY